MNNNINNCECPDQGGGRGRPPRGAPQRPAAPQGPRRPRGLVPARPPRGGPPRPPSGAANVTYNKNGRPPGQQQPPAASKPATGRRTWMPPTMPRIPTMPALADPSYLEQIEDLYAMGVLDHSNDCTGYNQDEQKNLELSGTISAVSMEDYETANQSEGEADECVCDNSEPPPPPEGDSDSMCVCDNSEPEDTGPASPSCVCPNDDDKGKGGGEDIIALMGTASQVSVYNPERLNTTMSPRNNSFSIRRKLMVSSFTQGIDDLDKKEEDLFIQTIENFHKKRRECFQEKIFAKLNGTGY